jgi:hypothetical protein
MDELSLDVAAVVAQSDLSSSKVYGLLKAEAMNPTMRVLRTVSRILKCDIEWLLGFTDNSISPVTTIPILGVAEGGAYRTPMPDKSSPDRIEDLPPADPRFRKARRFAVMVNDDRLEGLQPPVHRGQIALLIDFADAGLTVESGRIYLLHRRNASGQIESAFWRAQVFREHIEFAPMSHDETRNRNETIKVPREELEDNDELMIAGILYGATHRYL